MRLPFKENAGIISADPVWVWFPHGPYMYTGYTLIGVIWDAITNWHSDKRLC